MNSIMKRTLRSMVIGTVLGSVIGATIGTVSLIYYRSHLNCDGAEARQVAIARWLETLPPERAKFWMDRWNPALPFQELTDAQQAQKDAELANMRQYVYGPR